MSETFELSGKLDSIGETIEVTDKFKKREFVLYVENESNPQYSDHIKFELSQDNCSKLDNVDAGDLIKVGFNVSGRKYISKKDGSIGYFNSLRAWRIESGGSAAPEQPQNNAPETGNDEPGNPLPF